MKKLFIILSTVICLICLAIDAWCIMVYTFGDRKEVSNTMEIDMLETADGSHREPFIEVNYYSNKKQNGLEMFEIKLNCFIDESQERLMSVGMQYIANTVEGNIAWDTAMKGHYDKHSSYGFLGLGHRIDYEVYFNTFLTGDNSYYEYQSTNNYETVLGNTINKIKKTSRFKVTLGDEMFELGLKFDTPDEDFYLGYITYTSIATIDHNERYKYVDQHLLAHDLYESMQSAQYGENIYEIAKFANYFTYYQFDGDTYVQMKDVKNSKVRTDFENYYVIKVNKSEDGARIATDSMFNAIKGDSTFNLNGEHINQDYYYGRNIINVGLSDFDRVMQEDGTILLTLKSSFIEAYKPYKGKIALDINIESEEPVIIDEETLSDFRIINQQINITQAGYDDGVLELC